MSSYWKMESPCENCPFSDSENGQQLASTLAPGRLESIKAVLLKGQHFTCHKTIYCEKPSGKVCAGAMKWQEERGVKADLVQVMERLEAMGIQESSLKSEVEV